MYICLFEEPQLSSSEKKVFGAPLLSHLESGGRKIAVPIEECVSMLLRTGLREEVCTHAYLKATAALVHR